MDGDEWKLKIQENNWNEPNKVFLYEYHSFLEILSENILRPIVKGGLFLDRISSKMLKEDLGATIANMTNYKLKKEVEDAYWNLKNFVDTLNDSTDEEIKQNREVLEGILELSYSCTSFGDSMKELYIGRNPCRGEQYKFVRELTKSKIEQGNTNFLKKAEKIYSTCKFCPYRK